MAFLGSTVNLLALVFLGRTICVICGKEIENDPDIFAFPAFLKAGHHLTMFSDAAVHSRCLATSVDGQEAVELYRRFREIWESRPKNVTFEQSEVWGREAFREFDAK